jgi:P-loop containing NTP hydrolase pore-1
LRFLFPFRIANAGYFLGDGTGVGKGRQLAGIIFENWLQKRRKHIWISASADLHLDAQRDLVICFMRIPLLFIITIFIFCIEKADIGAPCIKCINLAKVSYSEEMENTRGVLFLTYRTLISKSRHKSRFDQILDV